MSDSMDAATVIVCRDVDDTGEGLEEGYKAAKREMAKSHQTSANPPPIKP